MDIRNPFEKIYIKDFDGNILYTSTPILLEELQSDGSWEVVEVSGLEYDHNKNQYSDPEKYRFVDNDPEETFRNYRDIHSSEWHRGFDGLKKDVHYALEHNHFAPSFDKFVEQVLIGGNLFALLTARGNTPDNLKNALMIINDEILSKEDKDRQLENIRNKFWLNDMSDREVLAFYFDINCYLPVGNKEFCKIMDIPFDTMYYDKKAIAMDRYISYLDKLSSQGTIIASPSKLWFSDDTYENIESMLYYFLDNKINKKGIYNGLDYRLYYTGQDLDTHQDRLQHAFSNNVLYDRAVLSFEKQKSSYTRKDFDILKINIDKK